MTFYKIGKPGSCYEVLRQRCLLAITSKPTDFTASAVHNSCQLCSLTEKSTINLQAAIVHQCFPSRRLTTQQQASAAHVAELGQLAIEEHPEMLDHLSMCSTRTKEGLTMHMYVCQLIVCLQLAHIHVRCDTLISLCDRLRCCCISKQYHPGRQHLHQCCYTILSLLGRSIWLWSVRIRISGC